MSIDQQNDDRSLSASLPTGDSFDLDLKETFGNRFQFESLIGKGGMGVIYKARDLALARTVAIKVLRSQRFLDRNSVMRFQREAQAASRLDHPGVIKVLEFGVLSDTEPYLVLEYVDGQPLSQVILNKHFITVQRVVRLALQICSALAHAHERGVLHRDLKPGNIVLTQVDGGDQIKLLDFGIAKVLESGMSLTQTGDIFGSPLYMSPEQGQGQRMDARSDIYSLGCCLYEMLVGTPPFVGSTMLHTLQMHASEQPFTITIARPDVPEALEALVFKAIAKEPAERYQTVNELRQALLQLNLVEETAPDNQDQQEAPQTKAVETAQQRKPGFNSRAGHCLWRHRTSIAAALVMVLLGTAVAYFGWSNKQLNARLEAMQQHEKLMREAEALKDQKKPNDALEIYNRALTSCISDAQRADVYMARAILLMEVPDTLHKRMALDDLDRYLHCLNNTALPEYYLWAVNMACELGQRQRAEQFARAGLTAPIAQGIEPIPAFCLQQAHLYSMQKSFADAVKEAFYALHRAQSQRSIDEAALKLTQLYFACVRDGQRGEANKLMNQLLHESKPSPYFKAGWYKAEASRLRQEGEYGMAFPIEMEYKHQRELSQSTDGEFDKRFKAKLFESP